ncbi:photosystem I assembly factor PSA3, chloroplastic [Olea europaea var. sylvestris]|nr:photosystem I assembly factor PSA3, chloroplastic [Olea europaea var. sylvestris]
MVALSSLQTQLHSSANAHLVPFSSCKPTSPFLLYFRRTPRRPQGSKPNGVYAYMEEKNSISSFANKVIGSLPVVGLVARIFSDEGGVGGDFIDFAEFRRKVGKKCSINDSRAFYEFKDRRGRAGDPLYVLLCCWLAAVGAGLLKSEEILEGVARLRISNDIEFEEENFIAMMNEAREKRAKLRSPVPSIPMVVRAEKALEAIYVCCYGRDPLEEEDERLLRIILNAVFPTVGQPQIETIINEKAKRVAEGTDEIKISEPMPLSKEAVQMQMKDLQFLRQGDEKS